MIIFMLHNETSVKYMKQLAQMLCHPCGLRFLTNKLKSEKRGGSFFWPCGMWNLSFQLELNQRLMHWKCIVLTTGWPGKSRNALFKLDINNVSAVCQFKARFYRLRGKERKKCSNISWAPPMIQVHFRLSDLPQYSYLHKCVNNLLRMK